VTTYERGYGGVTLTAAQYAELQALYNSADDIVLAGHSLGGAMAQLTAKGGPQIMMIGWTFERGRLKTFFIASFLCLKAGVVQAGGFEYDPSKCSGGAHDAIYVALDREVFRFPKADLTFIGTKDSSSELVGPSSTDPVGCPGNPVKAKSFAFAIHYLDQPNKTLNPMLETFELVSVSPGYWGLQTSDINTANSWCAKPDATHKVIGEQLEQCRLPSAEAEPEEQSGAFRAVPQRYSAPFDKPFVVICLRTILTTCEVNYKYLPTINLHYQFLLSKLPPSKFIEFDRTLREGLEAARQPNYPWAN
jgi:hypothetical protein